MIEGLKALGKTVFLTTHYMDEAQHLADRVAILRAGRIVALGRPDELGAGSAVGDGRDLPPARPRRSSRSLRAAGRRRRRDRRRHRRRSAPPTRRRCSGRLLAWADERRVALEHLEVRRPDLEDIFLELVGDDAPGVTSAAAPRA